MQNTAINVGLHIGRVVIDLRIPRFITLARLKELLIENLAELPFVLPKNWEIILIDKNVVVNQNVMLSEYPIGDGDQLKIVEIQDI